MAKMKKTCEQQARDILERCGWERAQSLTAGDVCEVANLIAEIRRLQAIVAKLPKTADGVPVVPGMEVHELYPSGELFRLEVWWAGIHAYGFRFGQHNTQYDYRNCYSTREAAGAAGDE